MSNRIDFARRNTAGHPSTGFALGGAIVPHHTAVGRAKPLPVKHLPGSAIDLVAGMNWPSRNQLDRNNCIAYATLACVELARALAAKPATTTPSRLSAGFLYASMRQNPPDVLPIGWEAGGTMFSDAVRAIGTIGLCPIGLCPDNVQAMWPLPAAALKAAAQDVLTGVYPSVSHKPGDPPEGEAAPEIFASLNAIILDELGKKRPVGVSFALYPTDQYSTNWEDCGQQDGTLRFPDNPDVNAHLGGHAVCVTGFEPSKDKGVEGGYFIFRDSAGVSFPRHRLLGSTGDGYGRVSLRDMRLHCWDVLLLRPLREPLP